MGKTRKVLGALGVATVALLVAATLSWTALPEGDKRDVREAIGQLAEGGGETARSIDWGSLPEEVVAWVEVPGTSIDEPVAQAVPSSPNAYLYEDALGQGAYGTPYIDCECALDSRFVVVYGHHMSDGSVFADFAGFADEAYARSHDQIIVYRRDGGPSVLEVAAVDVVDASRERLVVDQGVDFGEVVEGADLVVGDTSCARQLFAFVTCSYQTSNSRTVVYAALA